MPVDGYPVLGASPARKDVYLAVMHSGVTLAPIIGELAAHEMTESALAEPFRNSGRIATSWRARDTGHRRTLGTRPG
jgi:glycine/D-amino acid oxidase-like deaminating enzyme